MFNDEDVHKFHRSLKDVTPLKLQVGWDLPLSVEEKKQERTYEQQQRRGEASDCMGDGEDHLLTAREDFDMADPELQRDVIDSSSDSDAEEDDDDEDDVELLGYKMDNRSTSLKKVAESLKLKASTLVDLNKVLFYQDISDTTKIPKGTIIRVVYPEMTTAEKENRNAKKIEARVESIKSMMKMYLKQRWGTGTNHGPSNRFATRE